MPRPRHTEANRHYFNYPDAECVERKRSGERPDEPSPAALKHGNIRKKLSLYQDAMILGKELGEIWEN